MAPEKAKALGRRCGQERVNRNDSKGTGRERQCRKGLFYRKIALPLMASNKSHLLRLSLEFKRQEMKTGEPP